MTDINALLDLLGHWVTVTHADTPRRVSHGRLVMVMEQPSIGIELPGGGQEMFPAAFHVEGADPTAVPPPDADQPRPWVDLRTSGLLWLINRTAFHPRGLALAVHVGDDGEFDGWSLLTSDEGEPWQFDLTTDYDGHRRAEATLAAALRPAGRLLACGWCYEEHGEEVHPHPECPISSTAPVVHAPHLGRAGATPGTIDQSAPCCVCGGGRVAHENYQGQLFCWLCADCDCGIDGLCIRTGLHRPVPASTCTASFQEGFHGLAHCERHHAKDPHGRLGPWHEGRSQDGSTLFWQDGDNGATTHRPDPVQAPCPDTDTAARTPADNPALTSTDTVRTPCPDSQRTPGPDTARTPCPDTPPDGVRTMWTMTVPRRQMGAALAEAFGIVTRIHEQARDEDTDERGTADEEADPDDEACPLGPDGLTDVERQLKTIREAMHAELSQPDERALQDLALAVNRAVHAMPRYGARRPADDSGVREITALRDRVGELADALADILGRFTIPAIIDKQAHVRTGYAPVTLVNQWRTVHAGKSLPNRTFPQVQGRCPACARKTLFLGSGGYVTCSNDTCTEPDAPACTLATAYAQVGAHERALHHAAAYEAARIDLQTAVKYIELQVAAGPLSPLRDGRARILTSLTTWVKDPGPLNPSHPRGGA